MPMNNGADQPGGANGAVTVAATSLSGPFLDAFRTRVTQQIQPRPASTQSADSPGAMLDRLRKLTHS